MQQDAQPVTGSPNVEIRTHQVEGLIYAEFLRFLHKALRPRRYFEIGTLSGSTLALAECPAVAVDPKFQIIGDVVGPKPYCGLYQETSDEFFAKRDPALILGGAVDLAFLDGMHLLEFLLRDFINTERCCAPGSIIALHDCLPPDIYMTVRDPDDPRRGKSAFPGYWTGDVWKIVPILRDLRPDLRLTILDCVGTGLVLVSNLDPHNRVLSDHYPTVNAQPRSKDLNLEEFERYWSSVEVVRVASLLSEDVLRLKFQPFR